MTVQISASLTAAFACALAVLSALDANAATTAKSYIQDGLVAHWDAIENAGYGLHDDTTNVWTDLKGFCDLAVVNSASTWASDAFVPPQKSYGAAARDEASKISYATYRSIDVCATRYYYSDSAAILGQNARTISWLKDGFLCHNSSTKGCLVPLVTGTPYSIYANYKSNDAAVLTNYIDGVAVWEESVFHTPLSVGAKFQIGRDVNEWWSSKGRVNSVRLYSRALEPWEILLNANVDQIRFRGTDGATLAWPEGLGFVDGSVCYRTTATTITYSSAATSDNKLRVDDGEPSAAPTAWKPIEGTCTLTPVPDANHKFSFWKGDIDGLEIAADGTLTLDNSARSVTAVFVPSDSSGIVREWTGEAGDGNWTTAGNWSPAGVPDSYDSLTLPTGQTAVLGTGEDTPLYLAVNCAGTLVLSNWTTRLRAFADVNVLNGGVLTCANAILSGDATNSTSYAEQTFSRVWVACSNLTVFADGKIDLKLKGWRGAPGTIQCRGYGPGSSKDNFGAAHGGHGGGNTTYNDNGTALLTPSMPYDDPCAPVQPGSSGASYHANSNNCRGSSGGGVLRVEASGVVTVNGTIIADGQDALGYGQSSVRFAKAASGGSVYITCREIAGSGVISANGGGGDSPTGSSVPGFSGGGGCIAIYYDVNAQQASSVRGMKITAAAGQYRCYGSYKPGAVGELGADGKTDVGRKKSDIGTLRFSDSKIVDELLGNGLSGQIAGISPYVYDGDLSFDYGHVRFADTGAVVTVTGSLALGGEDSRLEIGGCEAKWRTVHVDIYGGDRVNSLNVGGDLTLGGVSRLDVRSAETNGVDAFGAVVKVGGTMTISTNCFVYAWSDVVNTGSPHFEVGGLNVATGGVFSAKRRGGAGAYKGSFHIYGNSSGKNSNPGTGGGHGGAGGYATATRGAVSDSEERPSMPGAGGGSLSGYAIGGAGGGVVSVAASNGTIRVDGTVVCDGESMSGYCAGGAGGALLLEAGRLVVGETGVLSAKGGAVTPSKYTTACTGGGGGGRIALYCGQPWSASLPRRRTNRSSVPFVADEYPDEFILLGTVDASGGETKGTYADNGKAGEDGTVLYCHVKEPAGMVLIYK